MTDDESGFKVQLPGPSSVGRAYRRTLRVKDVLAILLRNGLGDIADALRREHHGREHRGSTEGPSLAPDAAGLSHAERIRRAIEELGPTFVKFGQILSTRADLVPADLLSELAKLQDEVPPFDFEEVEAVVEQELGQPPSEFFEAFDSEVLASASLGQVHRARLNGREVVVKVQRPGVRRTIEADLGLMARLAELLERHVEGWAAHEPSRVVRDFADSINRELNYELEAAQQERFARRFEDDPTIFVPAVYREATTSRVLTMDYVSGVKVSDLEGLDAIGADRRELARRGFRLVLEQALIDGFFHADPHPGNIFVLPDNVVSFIDFGMMGRLSRAVRDDFVELIYHVVNDDAPKATRAVIRLTVHDEAVETTELEREVAYFIDSYMGRPIASLDLGRVLGDILEALAGHGLRVRTDLFLMLKALSEIEAIAVSLDPEFDLVAEAQPYVRQIFMDRFRPGRVAEDLAGTGRELAKVLRDAPDVLRDLSAQAQREGVRVQLDHQSTPEVLRTSDRIGNRLAFAFVLGSSLVGSAIIASAGIAPLWRGISVLGLGGFLVSLVMSVWLLASILRHGRL